MACAYKILQLSRHVPCCKGPILATDKYIFIQPRISKGGQATFNSNSPDAANYSLKPNTYTPLIQVCTYPSHRNTYIYIYVYLSLSPNSLIVYTPLRTLMDEVQAALEIQGTISFFQVCFQKKPFTQSCCKQIDLLNTMHHFTNVYLTSIYVIRGIISHTYSPHL